jgi:hypothetical protein
VRGELDIIPIEVFKSASFLLTAVLPPSPTTWRNYDLRPSVPDERPAGFCYEPSVLRQATHTRSMEAMASATLNMGSCYGPRNERQLC